MVASKLVWALGLVVRRCEAVHGGRAVVVGNHVRGSHDRSL